MPHSKDKRQRTSSTSSSESSWPSSVTSRAERSRHAAKMRRDKEGVEISTLAKLLPYPDEVTTKLDKGSIIRLTTSYLRMKKFTQKDGQAMLEEGHQETVPIDEETLCPQDTPKKESNNDGTLMLQALNGFVIFISRKGKIFFISDNVGKHLGVHQYEMTGNSVMEFIHPDDHKELAKQFVVQVPGRVSVKGMGVENVQDNPTSMTVNFFDDSVGDDAQIPITDYIQDRQFFLRMRSVMSRRGTGGKGKVVGFRVVNFSGRLKLKHSANQKGYMVEGLVCLCRPIQPQPILEIRMDGNMFMSRHGLDMSFTFCDPRIITLIGYEPHELLGKTAYQFHNPLDAMKVSDCHFNLIDKGSSMSKYYRFMGKNGDWVWMQTKATIIYNTNNVAQYVVCMNYVIGNDEGERHHLLEQMQKQQAAAAGLCVGKDRDCGERSSSCASVGSSGAATHASLSVRSPGRVVSSSGIKEPVIKMEVMDTPVDVTQYIPKPVRDNELILKPQPKKEIISFAKLLQTDDLKPLMYGIGKPMDTINHGERWINGISVKSNTENMSKGAVLDDESIAQMARTSQYSVVEPVSKHDSTYKPYSPVSDCESTSSGSSGSVNSPLVNSEYTGRAQLPGVQEDDETLFRDLLEITKNDTETQLPCKGDAVSSQNYMFTVNSPDNLSQLLGSPSNASMTIDSPSDLMDGMDETVSPRTPGRTDKTGGILAGLLNSQGCSDFVVADGFNKPLSNCGLLNMSVSKIDMSPEHGMGAVLPEDIADFSLDFCRSVMDQNASDIVTSMSGNFDLVQSFEDTMVSQACSTSQGASVCEIDTITVPDSSDLIKSVTPVTRTDAPVQYRTSEHSENKYPVPVNITVPTNISMTLSSVSEAPPAFATSQDPMNVTERISRLDIKDRQRLENTPLLHALLTGAEANPVTVLPVSTPQTPPVAIQNGLDSPQQSCVNNFDTFLTNINEGGTSLPDAPVINNNMLNQDDLTLLQQHERRRLLLLQEQQIQQEKLLEQQKAQQRMMENKFAEQLLQRKHLQAAMEVQVNQAQIQQQSTVISSTVCNGMSPPHCSLLQQTLTSQQSKVATSEQMFSSQQLRIPNNPAPIHMAGLGNDEHPQHFNYPVPNLTAANIQQLQQQQLKQQLLLQQQQQLQQQQLQQLQEQQQLAAQHEQLQQAGLGIATGQSLILQKAIMQHRQSSPPSSTIQSAMAPGNSQQFNLSTTSPVMITSSWTPTATSTSNLVNGTRPQTQ